MVGWWSCGEEQRPRSLVNAPDLRGHKRRTGAAPLVMVTAYDEPSARLADQANVDILLVGDSVGNVVLGYPDTLHVTMEDMIHHTKAVANARPRAMIVADLPWLSYHTTPADAVRHAGALIRAGANAVKLEGGAVRQPVVRALLDAEIPVIGHLGLTPQSVLAFGGYRVQAKTEEAQARLLDEALGLEREGVSAIVLEAVPTSVGTTVTAALQIPTIGIGAGPDTDGQVLVFHDVLGLGRGSDPKFVRRYAEIGSAITTAIAAYANDVRSGGFPDASESYPDPETTAH